MCLLKAKKERVRKKVYAAKKFARGAMVCPSCQYVLDDGMERCPKCRFSGQVAVERFPFTAPPLAPTLDPNNYLSPEEQASVVKKVLKFQKRLPQVRFLNCLVPMGKEVNLREFGFWLLNAGQLPGGDAAKAFAVLLLIDPKAKALSVTVGYGMEAMIMDSEWVQVCQDCRDLFHRQKYGLGIEAFLEGAFELLAERALKIEQEVKPCSS